MQSDDTSNVADVTVIQADRDFAGQIGRLLGYPFASVYVRDHPEMVDLVARHRLAHTPSTPAPGERLREAEVERLMHVIDRDRYVVAHCVAEIERQIRGREWLTQSRGPYEWDDDRFYTEFADAIEAIRDAVKPLAVVAWDKNDCTRIEERVNAARLAARELLAKPIGHRDMIAADLFADPRDAEIAHLKARLAALDAADDGAVGEKRWRPEVVAFANLMERQLRANDHKPGWKNDDPQDLCDRVQEESDELTDATAGWMGHTGSTEATHRANVAREAADVANMAMMVADVCGALSAAENAQ